jgi:rare lipoprotein A
MRRPQHRRLHLYEIAALLCALALFGCHKQNNRAHTPPSPPDLSDDTSGRPSARAASKAPAALPAPLPSPITPDALHGKPSVIEVGLASWYGPPYAGRKGADGSVYDQNAMTAANLTLPLGSVVRVTNLANEQSVIVRITDRGPFVRGRIIDLSLAAAKATGVYRAGVAKVRIEAYTPPPSPNSIPGGRWCVQIGAFYNPEDAIQLKNDLTRRYAAAKVIEFEGPTGYWVRINPKAADKASATQIADSIHIPDAEPYLTRTD